MATESELDRRVTIQGNAAFIAITAISYLILFIGPPALSPSQRYPC